MTTDLSLVLRLAGPLQAWGVRGGFADYRDTNDHPTRSGVLGLLACALGRPRGSSPDDLADLDLAIRCDRPGTPIEDFHTIGRGAAEVVPCADGQTRKGAVLTRRAYLTDASFTVALTGPHSLLRTLENALDHPVYTPFLGRRACPPTAPYNLGLHPRSATDVLATAPLDRHRPAKGDTVAVDIITTADQHDPGATHTLNDNPHGNRRFTQRTLKRSRLHLPADLCFGRNTTAGDRYELLHTYRYSAPN